LLFKGCQIESISEINAGDALVVEGSTAVLLIDTDPGSFALVDMHSEIGGQKLRASPNSSLESNLITSKFIPLIEVGTVHTVPMVRRHLRDSANRLLGPAKPGHLQRGGNVNSDHITSKGMYTKNVRQHKARSQASMISDLNVPKHTPNHEMVAKPGHLQRGGTVNGNHIASKGMYIQASTTAKETSWHANIVHPMRGKMLPPDVLESAAAALVFCISVTAVFVAPLLYQRNEKRNAPQIPKPIESNSFGAIALQYHSMCGETKKRTKGAKRRDEADIETSDAAEQTEQAAALWDVQIALRDAHACNSELKSQLQCVWEKLRSVEINAESAHQDAHACNSELKSQLQCVWEKLRGVETNAAEDNLELKRLNEIIQEHKHMEHSRHVISAALIQQVHFYFSRENLANDSYLLSRMDRDGYVPLCEIANFPRMQHLGAEVTSLARLLQESPIVEINIAGTSVRARYW
jgi:hypothetical protein